MSRFAAGQTLHSISDEPDEIGRLDMQFHAMAAQLEAARQELQARNEDLAHMNAEKSHFMGMAAHDLRNPLFIVLLSVDALLKKADRSQTDEKLLRRIRGSVKGMSNLVRDFLDVSLIEAGALRMRSAVHDLAAIARECVELTAFLAEQKQIEVAVDAREPVNAFVDRDKIAQVITNFLTNAMKFSPAGGRVNVSVHAADSSARLSVSDEGHGIAANEMERLFRPFSRTSTKPTAGETSTGLGLAICRKIIEGHGGQIRAESEVGKGSTFIFEIPASPSLPE
jgi:two-component system sensor histidine kinase/response regulator